MPAIGQRYHILKQLGSGGFGETFLAEDAQLPSRQRCVIKKLKPANDNPALRTLLQERFQREAVVLEQLGNACDRIPRLYAYFAEGGEFYLVQEWIDGQTLADLVAQQGPQSEEFGRSLLMDLLTTLEIVHGQGMVHRDLKPENVMLRRRDGAAVPIDFGAVKEGLRATVAAHAVPSSIIIGTPGFMPPEQAAGKPIFASDLYSLALTILFALTGRWPQEFPVDPQTGEWHWQNHLPRLAPDFGRVLQTALEPHPRDRYATAAAMRQALMAVPPTSPQVPTPRPAPVKATVAVAATCSPSLDVRRSGGWFWFLPVALGGAITWGLALKPPPPAVPPATPPPTTLREPEPVPPPSQPQPAFYFLADSSYANLENAANRVRALAEKGYAEAGRIAPGDFANVRDHWHRVYAGRYATLAACMEALNAYVQEVSDAYCAFASNEATAPDTKHFAQTPPPAPTPAPTAPVLAAPETAIRDYYALINDRRYKPAWAQLTPEFQQDRAGTYSNFFLWWESVAQVEVLQTKEVMADNDRAQVEATLRYRMKDGRLETEQLRITLVLGPENTWAIAATEYQ
ncbi:MAG: serine/threonine protein kinase [Oscillatoriales cyanobacterium SM2_1_8]|nr:serine/threonine protein kinase [Oscillatoriales cyanobacterium SM2_1_8]